MQSINNEAASLEAEVKLEMTAKQITVKYSQIYNINKCKSRIAENVDSLVIQVSKAYKTRLNMCLKLSLSKAGLTATTRMKRQKLTFDGECKEFKRPSFVKTSPRLHNDVRQSVTK